MPIGDWTEGELERFIEARLEARLTGGEGRSSALEGRADDLEGRADTIEASLVGDFLRLLVAGDVKVAYGDDTVTLGAQSSGSNLGTLAVTHGLPATPVVVLLTIKAGGSVGPAAITTVVGVSARGSSTFTASIAARSDAGTDLVNGTVDFDWLAIA